jgi:hypothetical protein
MVFVLLTPALLGQATQVCGASQKCPPDEAPQYFPVGSLATNAKSSDFIARIFRNNLIAMHEEPIGTAKNVYRLTEGFVSPRTFRLQLDESGTSQLFVKELSVRGAVLVEKRNDVLKLDKAATEKLGRLFDAVELWAPPEPLPRRPVLRADCRYFVLEKSTPSGYEVSSLDSCTQRSAFDLLHEELMSISKEHRTDSLE